jgi:hypothetical protein
MTTLIQPEPMTVRRLMRLAVVAALTGANLKVNGVDVGVQSPGDWTFQIDDLPAIAVRTGRESKASEARTQPQFTTTTTVELKAAVSATTAEAAQDALEQLWFDVESAILKNYSIVGASQQVTSIDSVQEISAEGQVHVAGITAAFAFECYEVFDPVQPDPALTTWPVKAPAAVTINQVTLDADLANVVDPTGTYPSPLFPQSVTPAPRTAGPDGRAEGGFTVNLPT